MKVTAFRIRNYRTLEKVDLSFASSYAAICGPNDSGKTNVIRAIRALMKEEFPFYFFRFEGGEELSIEDDYPKWKDTSPGDRYIHFEMEIAVNQYKDTGFYQFITKQLSLISPPEEIKLTIELIYRSDRTEPEVTVHCSGNKYDSFEAQEVLKRLQTSSSILFHNSTQTDPRVAFRSNIGGVIRADSAEHAQIVNGVKKSISNGLKKLTKIHQREIDTLFDRLETKYRISLTAPSFDIATVPYSVALGQKNVEVPLDDWGSGTKNRTLILMMLLQAKQLSESEQSAGKITPVIIIEEPESFLHPAAQAQFGRAIQELAEEFEIQVIVTTHSPYLLSIDNPKSNILLRREIRRQQLLETKCVDTSGDNWMEPFGLALGLGGEAFQPWKNLMIAGADAVLLVEGELDKQYFEMLRSDSHGSNKLLFSGDIITYDGVGTLQNTVLLKFIKNKHPKLFITYDLDSEDSVAKSLTALGLERKKDHIPVGVNSPGKRNIEGLLPESVTTTVYGSQPAVVQAATHGNKQEQKAAKQKLKKLLLEEFKKKAEPGDEYFGGFYAIAKVINRALS